MKIKTSSCFGTFYYFRFFGLCMWVWDTKKSVGQVSDTPQSEHRLRAAGHILGAPGGDALMSQNGNSWKHFVQKENDISNVQFFLKNV